MLEAVLYTHLKTHVSSAQERVYTYLLPQGCPYPAIATLEVSNNPEYDFSGDTGCGVSRYQVSVFAESYSSAKTVADEVKAAMALPIDGIQAVLTNCVPSYEAEMNLYHLALDYQVNYRPS